MEIENLEAANKAVKRLKEIQSNLDLVVEERRRMLDTSDKETNLMLRLENMTLEMDDDALAHEILGLLIGKYSKQKEELLEKIKSY